MFQREVAERIVARPGTGAYGRLAVLAQWRGAAEAAMKVHRSAFVPPPKVMSAVVHIVPGRAARGRRRRPTSSGSPPPPSASGARCCAARSRRCPARSKRWTGSDIDPERRAETLSVDEFVAIARALTAQRPDRACLDAAFRRGGAASRRGALLGPLGGEHFGWRAALDRRGELLRLRAGLAAQRAHAGQIGAGALDRAELDHGLALAASASTSLGSSRSALLESRIALPGSRCFCATRPSAT